MSGLNGCLCVNSRRSPCFYFLFFIFYYNTLKETIDSLVALGNYIEAALREVPNDKLAAVMQRSFFNNQWFTLENQQLALRAIATEMLARPKLENWLEAYVENGEIEAKTPKNVGLVMAGNLPLVGFHDLLCVLVAGHRALVKLSDKDPYLLPFLAAKLVEINPVFEGRIQFVEQLRPINAVIATGSNNTARYFEQYFASYPHIIRKSRTSIALLDGSETEEDLHRLGIDIFRYFGLGCRNVSKLFVPRDYDFTLLLEKLHDFNALALHNKYKNNFDYNFTLVILNGVFHLNNGCVILVEDISLHSRIAMLHYEFYDSMEDVLLEIETQKEALQCVVSNRQFPALTTIAFGKTQQPTLADYADGVDTLAFLIGLHE